MKQGVFFTLVIGIFGGISLYFGDWRIIIALEISIALIILYFKKVCFFLIIQFLGVLFGLLLIGINQKPLPMRIEGDLGKVLRVGPTYVFVEINQIHYVIFVEEIAQELEIGSESLWWGEIESLDSSKIPLIFSFSDYLHYQGIRGSLQVESYQIISNVRPNEPIIKELLLQGLSIETKEALGFILFGIHSENETSFYESLTNLSVLDLFVVSGFHLSLLMGVLIYLLRLFYRSSYDEYLALILMVPYIWLLNWSVSALRAILVPFLALLDRDLFHLSLGKYDVLAIIASALLIANPYYIFQLGFQFSFLATFGLYVFRDVTKGWNKFYQVLIIPLGVYLLLIPLILNSHYQISLLSPLFHLVLSLPVVGIFPLGLATLFFHPLEGIFYPIYFGLKDIIVKMSDWGGILILGKPTPWEIVLYYFALSLSLWFIHKQWWRRFFGLFFIDLILLVVFVFRRDFNPSSRVTFVDVGQGDCILIQGPFNQYQILIDTGGLTYLDLASERLVPYFYALGITSLDAVFITHEDFDHMGALQSLKQQFPIEQVIYNSEKQEYVINGLMVKNLNPLMDVNLSSDDSNEQSMVLQINIQGLTYLFTGDAPESVEHLILTRFKDVDCDVLKVGHHGSNSSTSESFLERISPSIAVISVGINNRYGHPSKEVIERLEEHHVPFLMTSQYGTITIETLFNWHFVMTALP